MFHEYETMFHVIVPLQQCFGYYIVLIVWRMFNAFFNQPMDIYFFTIMNSTKNSLYMYLCILGGASQSPWLPLECQEASTLISSGNQQLD